VNDTGAQAVADRLHELVAGAHSADTGDTAGRAVALAHARRRRGARWAAGALAVVLLGTAAAVVRPADVAPAEAAGPTTPPAPAGPAVYEQPPRGSLAGDREFLAAVQALPWSDLYDTGSMTLDVEPDTRRVVYAADVPGGHRWAVVLARSGTQWGVDWFTGPRGARADQLVEAQGPVLLPAWQTVALMDVSGTTGPLLVLDEAGVTAEYSPSLDRAADGSLGRHFDPLPVVDGAPLGMVTTPVTWDAGQLSVLRDGFHDGVDTWLTTGTPPWLVGAEYETDQTLVAACLSGLGYQVQDLGPGQGLTWTEPETGDLSSAEQAARDQQRNACSVRQPDA
jgi:hypothetical protein